MQHESARALWERWRDLYNLRGHEQEILKQEWFADAFLFVEKLPDGAHLWCAPGLQHVVWQLLEPLRFYTPGSRWGGLPSLWRKLSSPLRGCIQCVCHYYEAKDFYVQEFSPGVEPLLDVLRDLDRARVMSPLRRTLQKFQPIDREGLCVLFEILMYPEGFQDDQARKILMLVMRYAENTLALNPEIHPLLSGNNASRKLVESLELFRNADQRIILHGLRKLVKIFDETVSSSESTENDVILDLTDEECVNNQEAMTDECVKTATEETASAKPEVGSDRKKRPVSQDVPSCKKQRLEGKVGEGQQDFYDRAAFPAMLDEWHKRVLSLDIWSMHGDHSEELLEVPLTFQSYKHYLEIFRPLCFEEFKAHLERSLETMDLSRSDVVTAFSLRQEGYFHLVEFDGHTVKLAENDLILLRDPARTSHMIGKMSKRSRA
ncbi:uncharacterized protein LOC112345162 isoform X2 [Selaginella moellendorffii]|uniref:uncharacterized protein LOC112345162 isoform X2 n=1 Tax=Selaginella moellendorffii TaxID=88036 RepID=UPI000D1CA0CC|nr:uncharacterized protein LOC112345162 isoform X2 [Selaginella moellendorffii]|eukprot:XP_024527137.1 uncharacterized protein LOC112345162 isoform X2 [Selaginella moellendorffii]